MFLTGPSSSLHDSFNLIRPRIQSMMLQNNAVTRWVFAFLGSNFSDSSVRQAVCCRRLIRPSQNRLIFRARGLDVRVCTRFSPLSRDSSCGLLWKLWWNFECQRKTRDYLTRQENISGSGRTGCSLRGAKWQPFRPQLQRSVGLLC
jgi:hypothetical protein